MNIYMNLQIKLNFAHFSSILSLFLILKLIYFCKHVRVHK